VPSLFARAVRRATATVIGNRPLGRVLVAASALLGRNPAALRAVRRDAAALVRMARETVARRYHRVPKGSIIAGLAALVYLVNPLDLLPDLLPALGLVDDAVVITWVVRQVRRDLDAFLAWEREWGGAIDVDGSEVAASGETPALPPGG